MPKMDCKSDSSTPLLAGQRNNDAACSSPRPRSDDTTGNEDKDVERNEQEPRLLLYARIASAYYSFIVVGAWDGSYGAMVVYLREYYSIDYFAVSFSLLAPVVGYAIAAFINSAIHHRFGQRGVAIVAPACHIMAAFFLAERPKYPLAVSIFMIAGLGNGIADASWNSWIGAMPQGNGLMGLLHGFYGVGAALAPLMATVLIERAGLEWYQLYRVLGVASVVELGALLLAFWGSNAKQYQSQSSGESSGSGSVLQVFRYRSTWIISAFVFLYAGIEISLADWVSSFLIDVRYFNRFSGNMVTFAYWTGLTAGRVIVGFLASWMNWHKGTVTACTLLCLCACGFFRLVSSPALCATAVFLLGFFLGPLFPEAVVMQAKILPKQVHLTAIGFAVAFGSAGGSVLPFVVGLTASKHGIEVLQWFTLSMIVGCLVLWFALPGPVQQKRHTCDEESEVGDV